jgi:hypothetical protein
MVQEKWSEAGGIARFLETLNRIDCPSSVYQKKVQALYKSYTDPYTPEDTPRISNCYSVQCTACLQVFFICEPIYQAYLFFRH